MEECIKGKAISGMVWTSIEKVSTIFIQFILGIIIARILMPSDYGIIGMLTIFIGIAQTFLDSGFASALIQKKNRTETDYSTVFYFNIIISIFLYVIFYITAPYIARFYNIHILTDVTRIITLSLIIGGFSIVQQTKLSIDLNFKLQALSTLISVTISGLCGIIMAYNNFGVWALVFQNLLNHLLKTIILWGFSKWIPQLVFSLKSLKELFSFGSKLLCSSMINTIYSNIYTIVIGKFFNASEVGLYNRALQFASIPSTTTTEIITKVNFPILSQIQDDNTRLLQAYKKLLRMPLFILYPILFCIATLACPLIELILGTKWLSCVPYLQILCIGHLFYPLTHINLNLLYVKGYSNLVLKLELIKKPLAFAILIISIPFGIWWICLGNALYSFIAFVINCYYTNKILNYGFYSQIKLLLPILTYSFIMICIVIIVIKQFDNTILKLIIGGGIASITYILCAYLSKDETLSDIKKTIEEHFAKKG